MRFLLFNVAVSLALVYIATGDNAADMATAAIDKVKGAALASSEQVSQALEKVASEDAADTNQTDKLDAPKAVAQQDDLAVQTKAVEVKPAHVTKPAPVAEPAPVRTVAAEPAPQPQPQSAPVVPKAAKQLLPITQAREVPVARVTQPPQSGGERLIGERIVGENGAADTAADATRKMAEMAANDAPGPQYMSASQRAGELVRLVDDMELFAARMLAK